MASDRSQTAPTREPTEQSDPREIARSEEIHIRNHDPYRGYDLELSVTDGSDRTVFEHRYYLQPGQIQSVGGVLGQGVYEVTVELDNHRRKTLDCTVDASPGHTAHVEVGNGIVSLTEGLYR